MNGALRPWEEAQVHVGAHSLHYGTGIFEGIRCYHTDRGPAIFRLTDHVERFFQAADSYGMHIPFTPAEIERAAVAIVEANSYTDCYIRPIAFYGSGTLSISARDCPVHVAVLCWVWDTYLGQEGLRKGVRVALSHWRKPGRDSLHTAVKASGHYATAALAAREGFDRGYSEVLMLDAAGRLAGGSGQNLFLVIDGKLVTNDAESAIVPGITRDTVVELARSLGLETQIRVLTLDDLAAAEEAFFTGTACEVTPIREVDGKPVGAGVPGPVTQRIQQTYFDVVHGRHPQFQHWLRIVQPHATHASLNFF